MSKRPAISEMSEETRIKRTKYTNLARRYLDMEAVADSEAENEGTEEEGKSLDLIYISTHFTCLQRTVLS
jgi:hypothetical protein